MLLPTVTILALLASVAIARDVAVSWGFDVSQATVTVFQNDTIIWTLDQDAVNHTLTSPDITAAMAKPFGGNFRPGQAFSFLANLPPRSYRYSCNYHPLTMFAVLTVVARPPALLPIPGSRT